MNLKRIVVCGAALLMFVSAGATMNCNVINAKKYAPKTNRPRNRTSSRYGGVSRQEYINDIKQSIRDFNYNLEEGDGGMIPTSTSRFEKKEAEYRLTHPNASEYRVMKYMGVYNRRHYSKRYAYKLGYKQGRNAGSGISVETVPWQRELTSGSLNNPSYVRGFLKGYNYDENEPFFTGDAYSGHADPQESVIVIKYLKAYPKQSYMYKMGWLDADTTGGGNFGINDEADSTGTNKYSDYIHSEDTEGFGEHAKYLYNKDYMRGYLNGGTISGNSITNRKTYNSILKQANSDLRYYTRAKPHNKFISNIRSTWAKYGHSVK